MIKIEDNVSIVLLSIALVFNLMYAFMHIFDPFAVLFLDGISQRFNGEMTADLDAMVSNVGWFFMIFAIGIMMTLIVPKEESAVFLRLMVIATFITSIRMIAYYMDGQLVGPAPLVFSVLGFIGFSVVLRRLGLNKGTTL
jgi:hypothetical protein